MRGPPLSADVTEEGNVRGGGGEGGGRDDGGGHQRDVDYADYMWMEEDLSEFDEKVRHHLIFLLTSYNLMTSYSYHVLIL